MNNNLTELQERLLYMLKWFHSFCVENGLQYYLIYGTMLGAARHQGFIPWDDDIDVGMPRSDYDRLRQIMADRVIDGYTVETPYSGKMDYCYPITKVYDIHTTLIENKRHPVKRGIYIDVFPLDGIGNNYRESIRNFRKVEGWYNFLLTRTCGIRQGRSFVKNLAVRIMRCIPQSMINDSKLLCKVDELCSRQSYKENKYVASLLGAYGKREIVPKEIIGEPTLCHFEDVEVYGVQQPDHYLSHLYGDWRKLPPVEKQVSHHDYLYLSFDESYLKA